MFDHTQFADVFPASLDFPYDRKSIQEIETCRKSFNGLLFIDRVLNAMQISQGKTKSFPPKSEKALRSLHQSLCEAEISLHHRLSIFYYLLLDFDGIDNSNQFSMQFAQRTGVPKNYQIFMKGLWLLDHQQFEKALEHVTHPSLVPEFADEILITFVKHAPENDYTIPLSYYHTVQPALKKDEALSLLFDSIARTSVVGALEFSRSHPQAVREQLFRRLVASVLEGSPSEETATRAVELVGLSLDNVEETWFEEYLTKGEGRNLKHAKDTLLMRKITTGRYTDAVNTRGVGANWNAVLESMKTGLGGRTD